MLGDQQGVLQVILAVTTETMEQKDPRGLTSKWLKLLFQSVFLTPIGIVMRSFGSESV